MVSKELGYELTKIVPLSVIEKSRDSEYPNDLLDVGRRLKESHLPAWLVYAIEESDHQITSLDEKIPAYIDDETICTVAQEYVSKENPVINLARPGEYDWMQDNPMETHKQDFERNYNSALSSVESVFRTVFIDWDEAFVNEYSEIIARKLVDSFDMFMWEIYRTELDAVEQDVNTQIAEILVNEIHPYDLAQFYLLEFKSVTTYEDLLYDIQSVSQKIEDCVINASLASKPEDILFWRANIFGEQHKKVSALREEMQNAVSD